MVVNSGKFRETWHYGYEQLKAVLETWKWAHDGIAAFIMDTILL